MERDYNNYDYLSVSVKSGQLGRILGCYKSLGWTEVKCESDRYFKDMVYLLLSRPHKVAGKDRLQYLQVRMEMQLNKFSQIAATKNRKSIFLTFALAIFAIASLAAGLYFEIFGSFTFANAVGIIFFALATVCLAGVIYAVTALRKNENADAENKRREGLSLISRLMAEAISIRLKAENASALPESTGLGENAALPESTGADKAENAHLSESTDGADSAVNQTAEAAEEAVLTEATDTQAVEKVADGGKA